MPQFHEDITFKSMTTISTASAVTNHTAINVKHLDSMVAVLKVNTLSGTTHTLDVKFQTLMPDGNWYDMPSGGTGPNKFAFVQASATGAKVLRLNSPMGKKLRAVSTLGAASRGAWAVYGVAIWDS